MSSQGAVPVDVKENNHIADSTEKEVEETMDVPNVLEETSSEEKKAAVGMTVKPFDKGVIEPVKEETTDDENTESSIKEEEEVVEEDQTEQEPTEVRESKSESGAKKEEEKMSPKRGRKTAEKEEAGDVVETEAENVVDESVAKGKSPKGRKGKKEETKEEEQKEEQEGSVDMVELKKPAPKVRLAKKAAAPKAARGKNAAEEKEEEEKMDDDEEKKEAVARPKRGRTAAVNNHEPETKKLKKEEEKPAGRPRRGAVTRSAAAAKKIAEEDEEEKRPKKGAKEDEEEKRPKKGAKAKGPKKTAEKDSDEEEEDQPVAAKSRGGKQPGKKAVADDEDGPTSSKKAKIVKDEDEEENGKSGGKSMTKSIRRTVHVKGAAAVDPLCTQKAANSHVYSAGDLIYDVMLNQTNIGNNNNKFYVIQLLEEDDKNHYSVWTRWGRVGYDGQNKLSNCGPNLQQAIREFSSKFEAKTKNQWPTAFADFQTHAGKYTMIEMDYGSGAAEGEDAVKIEEQEEEEKKCKVESKLDTRVQQLMHLMCSIRQMTQAVKQLEFDADKSPLGKLTQQQIKEGYACLGKIEKFIERKDFGAEFKQAVNEYYTKVPHACGFRPPAMIRTPQLLKSEIELLDLLSGIEYAIKTMKQETKEEDVHPVDRHYASLKCGLHPMEKEEEEYKLVAEYLSKTHANTHTIQMGLKNVFRVGREGEEDNEEVMDKIGNRKLLWHGSRLSNYFGILSQGLRIAPPEAPCTGYMFGKGVYFADMATKSGNYCYASEDGQTGFLLLAEVALGDENLLKHADYNANNLPAGKNSTWGMGRTMPDPSQSKQLNEKVVVPCGKPIPHSMANDASLLYNEFIVYNTQQIRLRYLLEVQFNFV